MAKRISTPEGKALMARLNRERLQAHYGIQYHEYWHGAAVSITKNGSFRIFVSADQKALALSLGEDALQTIQAHGGPATIEFAKTGIALKVGKQIVLTKTRKTLSNLDNGAAWVKQLDREVEHLEKGRFTSLSGTSQSMAPDNRDSVVTQQQNDIEHAVLDGDLRHRLLSNAVFKCTKWELGKAVGRVCFRYLTVTVPKPADVEKDVRVLCELSAENSSHHTPCMIEAPEEDPARRLGIRLTFFNKVTKTIESQWIQQKGEQNLRKSNSLADFLLGKALAYTQDQPRRYLGKRKWTD